MLTLTRARLTFRKVTMCQASISVKQHRYHLTVVCSQTPSTKRGEGVAAFILDLVDFIPNIPLNGKCGLKLAQLTLQEVAQEGQIHSSSPTIR